MRLEAEAGGDAAETSASRSKDSGRGFVLEGRFGFGDAWDDGVFLDLADPPATV